MNLPEFMAIHPLAGCDSFLKNTNVAHVVALEDESGVVLYLLQSGLKLQTDQTTSIEPRCKHGDKQLPLTACLYL